MEKNDGNFSLREKYYSEGDYVRALGSYMVSADSGNTQAMLNIGMMYAKGQGSQVDFSKAVAWFRKAAEAGNRIGQRNLGWAYESGDGVEKNLEEAAKWYGLAAENDSIQALIDLSICFLEGKGIAINYEKAYELAIRAAEKEYIPAFSIKAKVEKLIREQYQDIDNIIYRQQSEAHEASLRCLKSLNSYKGLCQTFIQLEDIGTFEDKSDSLMNDTSRCIQSMQRYGSDNLDVRKTPCYVVFDSSNTIKGKYGYLIEDVGY